MPIKGRIRIVFLFRIRIRTINSDSVKLTRTAQCSHWCVLAVNNHFYFEGLSLVPAGWESAGAVPRRLWEADCLPGLCHLLDSHPAPARALLPVRASHLLSKPVKPIPRAEHAYGQSWALSRQLSRQCDTVLRSNAPSSAYVIQMATDRRCRLPTAQIPKNLFQYS